MLGHERHESLQSSVGHETRDYHGKQYRMGRG
jgi:hypothetical protein